MAQHDYVIDNGTGAAVRTDINNVLQAIASNNSGSGAPSTTYAFQLFADTTNNVMKIRNAANNAFIELFQLDGTFTLEDGSASTPALAFRDDLNTGIFSSAADTFNVATGGVERMELGTTTIFNEDGEDVDFRIESDDNANMFFVDASANKIGFGTSTIVDGVFCFNGGTANGVANFISTDAGANISLTDNSARSTIEQNGTDLKIISDTGGADPNSTIKLQVDASTKMTINSSGNVGIGTTDPTLLSGDGGRLLHLAGSDNPEIVLERTTSGTEAKASVRITDTKHFRFAVKDGSASVIDALTINSSNGNVGIGTTSPSAKLHVVEATSTTAVKIKSGTSTNQSTHVTLFNDSDAPLNLGVFGSAAGTAGAIAANTAFMSTNSAAGLAIAANNASGTIKFGTGSSTTTRMFIDSSGNVSVGGTSPSTQSAKFQTTGTSQDETRINMHHEGNSSASISANGGLVFGSDTSNGTTQRMIIDTSGNIGAPSGTNIFNASDSRVKTNVVNLEKGLSDIKSLRPVSFNWIDGFCDEEKNTLYGFIAQEVQTVDSNLIQDFSQEITVKDTKIENVLRVNEKFIIPMLVKAIQELSAKVEALEAA
tara:strand:- start:123 stop:1919 length:1797 start_codon:yes stop_codon:yes gene_type:complete